jgi:hypothetical protein
MFGEESSQMKDPWTSSNILHVLGFTLLTSFFGPMIARPLLHVIEWELHAYRVRMSHQLNDFYKGIPYSLALYTFGNYSNTFDWIIALMTVVTLFIYARIAEIPYLKVSLHSKWNWKARIVMIVGFSVIFMLALYHFYLAWQNGVLWPWYACAAIAGIVMAFVIPFIVHHLDVQLHADYYLHRCLRRFVCCCVEKVKLFSQEKDSQLVYSFDPNADDHSPSKSPDRTSPSPKPVIPPGPEKDGISVHIHHWQLFVLLAFFTRFEDVISKVCAGIVLGIYCQGIAAYGYDEVLC